MAGGVSEEEEMTDTNDNIPCLEAAHKALTRGQEWIEGLDSDTANNVKSIVKDALFMGVLIMSGRMRIVNGELGLIDAKEARQCKS